MFEDIARLALVNAERMLEDSRLLIDKRSFGHAFGLGVLADEEIAKGKLFWLASLGFANTRLTGKELRMGERILQPFRSHRMKQGMQFGVRLAYNLIMPVLDDLLPLLGDKEHGLDRAVMMVPDYVENLFKDEAHWKEVMRPLFELVDIQAERDRALYVDIAKDKVTSPLDFSEQRCREYVLTVESELDKAKKMFGLSLPKELVREGLTVSLSLLKRRDVQKYLREHGAAMHLKSARKEIEKLLH